jgi:hypothetical protein
VEADPRLLLKREVDGESDTERATAVIDRLRREVGAYHNGSIRNSVLTPAELAPFSAGVLSTRIRQEIALRSNVQFLQLFNYRYADGAQMVTFGGLIDSRKAINRVRRAGIESSPFVSSGRDPISITVPPVTVREKLWLDSNLGLSPKRVRDAIGMRDELQMGFRQFYRQYPSYFESIA